jgi:predicted methyltransferase
MAILSAASRRDVVIGAASFWLAGSAIAGMALGGCSRKPVEQSKPGSTQGGPEAGSLQWAAAGDWRAADRPRDRWRHPEATLLFFGLKPDLSVVEVWPGKGFWTEILAPYLARNGGELHDANFELGPTPDPAQAETVRRFEQRFSNMGLYGRVRMSEFGPKSGPLAPAGSADLVLFMDTVGDWMAAGLADKAFHDAYAALKPGGMLGVVQARANIGETQDPAATNGYVQEPYVKQLAAEAGFAFAGASEINANSKDTKDHPFGVWTLPPYRLSAPRGQPDNPNFNHAKYDLIGEADRMSLRFRKPR